MESLVASLVAGTVFGVALAAPPGPMNAVIAEESVLRGWTAGSRAGLGAFSADVAFFVLAAVGVVELVETAPTLKAVMVGAGGVLMLYFAYGAIRDARDGSAFVVETDVENRGFTKAFALAITNPYQIVFWLTVGVRMLRPDTIDVLAHTPYVGGDLEGVLVVTTGSPALLVGFFLGILVWVGGFPATLVVVGRRVDKFAPAVATGSALVLAGFGVLFLGDAATALL
jgi:threonine/homoserine/homoserine lactone efflux protein